MVGNAALTEQPVEPQDYGPLALNGRLRGAGKWESFLYSGPEGSRRYFVYTPSGYTLDERVPMVVMLHGCAQTPADSAAGTGWNPLADRHRFVVVYPAQNIGDNALLCWNWFVSAQRGSGEPSIVAGISQQVIASDTRWNIDRTRVYTAGLSAGGAMAVLVGATYPDIYAAVAIHSGLEYEAATDGLQAGAAMQNGGPPPIEQGTAAFEAMNGHGRVVPTVAFHGAADETVNPINGDQVVQQWIETNRLASNNAYPVGSAKEHNEQVPNGHAYTISTWSDEHGNVVQEYWRITDMAHAWSGGSVTGSFTDPRGPDATEAIWAFFSNHRSPQ